MKSLSQPRTIARAALAGLFTAAACYPRLANAQELLKPLWAAWLILLWCAFMLWAFVFAWHAEYSGQPVFGRGFPWRDWTLATAFSLAWAAAMYFLMDTQLRQITPADYPIDWRHWSAMTLFSVAFEPLCLCFAPFAFFVRLTRRPGSALAWTVAFGILMLYFRLNSSKALPPPIVAVELMGLRILAEFTSVYFYLRGGAGLIWWMALLSQLRLVFEFG